MDTEQLETPVLCNIALEKSVCIDGDIAYGLGDGASQQNFISLFGVKKPLVPLGDLSALENFQYIPVLTAEIELKVEKINEEIRKVNKEFKSAQSLSVKNEFDHFLRDFFMLLTHTPDHANTAAVKEISGIDSILEPQARPASINSQGGGGSVFKSVFKRNLLLTNVNCYSLMPRTSPNGLDEYVVLNGRVHSLEYLAMLDGIEQPYKNELTRILNSASDSAVAGKRKQIETAIAETQKKWGIPAHPEFGHLIDGDDYYIWKNCPRFSLRSNVQVDSTAGDKTWYDFPSCRIGVKLVKKNNSIMYYDQIYAIASRQIKKGVEVGEMVNLKGKQFKFPATPMRPCSGYPLICITPEPFKIYKGSEIQSLLNAAFSIMKSYVDGDDAPPTMTIYAPIDEEHDYFRELLSPNQVR